MQTIIVENKMDKYICRCCGSDSIIDMGELPSQTYFAGKLLNSILPTSRLYKCKACFMLARHPILTTNEYNKLYADAETTVWMSTSRTLRVDQKLVLKMIEDKKINRCRILDIGCYTGELLEALSDNYTKFGVEMSTKAASQAKEKNIKIIGNDLYKIDSTEKFDIVVAIDVIEHTQNPAEFILNLIKLLKPTGELIISTGNTDNWMWRYLKNKFWYSSFPEHISFIGVNWLFEFATKQNLIVTKIDTFNYAAYSSKLIIKNIVKLLLSILMIKSVGYSNITKDHFYFGLKIQN